MNKEGTNMTDEMTLDLAAMLPKITAEINLLRGVWIVRIGEGIAAHEDIEIAVEAAVVMMASLASVVAA